MNCSGGLFAENLAQVRARIARAAAASARSPEEITLVAVTKYVGPPEVRGLVEAGCHVLGESRPQQLWDKAEALTDLPVSWHMIGHLQRNKVRRTLPLVTMIESVDSERLLETIDRVAGELSRRMPVLLEINVSGESAKHGFDPDAAEALLERLPRFTSLEVRGLMCMASLHGGLDAARRDFCALRNLRDRLLTICPDGVTLDELSMGMSADYEVAVQEGATMVRIGSALFQGIPG
jgi:pyridoxal phosphate enzyme (YggS family)